MVTAPVTVITPTIPGREESLAQCLRSVYDQTVAVAAHIVVARQKATEQPRQVELAHAQNMALAGVETPWVIRLADDDKLTPNAVEVLMSGAPYGEVVYGPDEGNRAGVVSLNGHAWHAQAEFFRDHDTGQASGDMYNVDLLRSIGGWTEYWWDGHFHHPKSTYCLHPYEDRATRAVLAQNGAKFYMVSLPTWVAGLTGTDRIGQQALSWQPCS